MNSLKFLGTVVEQLGNPAARNVIVFLHGTGDTGRGVKDWVSSLVRVPPDYLLLFPTAPSRPYSMHGGAECRVWHDRTALHIETGEDVEGLERMCSSLHSFLRELVELAGVDRDRLTLGGFSQGGHLTLQSVYGPGSPDRLEVKRAFALSCFLTRNSRVYQTSEKTSSPPLFLSTGEEDTMVEVGWVEETRKRLEADRGVDITYSTRPYRGHEMDSLQLKNLFMWITEHLQK